MKCEMTFSANDSTSFWGQFPPYDKKETAREDPQNDTHLLSFCFVNLPNIPTAISPALFKIAVPMNQEQLGGRFPNPLKPQTNGSMFVRLAPPRSYGNGSLV